MYISDTRTQWGHYGTETKFFKFKTDMYQWIELKNVHEKNGVIHLIMFTARVLVIKMSKMAHFMYFLLDTVKHPSQFGQCIYMHLQDLIWPFEKILWIMYFWATISKIASFKNTGFRYSFVDSEIFLIFIHNILRTIKSKACWSYHFKQEINNICHVYLNVLPNLWQTFCSYQQKMQNISDFWHFKDYKYRRKHGN